jgi:hypothetical protein
METPIKTTPKVAVEKKVANEQLLTRKRAFSLDQPIKEANEQQTVTTTIESAASILANKRVKFNQ